MYCEECGARAEPGARFCTSCGLPMGEESSVLSVPPVESRGSAAPVSNRSKRVQWPFLIIVGAIVAGVAAWAVMTMRTPSVDATSAPGPVVAEPSATGNSAENEQDEVVAATKSSPDECHGMIGKPIKNGQYIVIWEDEERILWKTDYPRIADACRVAQALFGSVSELKILDSQDYSGRNINTWNRPAMWTPYTGPYNSEAAADAACTGTCNVRPIVPCRTDGSAGDACG